VSAYPVMVDGAAITALVVGGGRVGARRALALADAGARVRVVAPVFADTLRDAATRSPTLTLAARAYASGDIGDATLVVAATSSREVNARVAADARAQGRLVNVVDAPGQGNFVAAATHRAGDLVVAISAGGVPTAAARIRDCVAARFDGRYAAAVAALGALRRQILRERGPAAWREVAEALTGPDFCAAVESGDFRERLAQWR
jgi:precorrin-2 dehydrogenase / sirohydrochlorin ferrochelatase